jgi:transposase InsO family protein
VKIFFSHLKSEDIALDVPDNEAELVVRVKDYIDFYNYDRPQCKLKGMTPIEYRNHAQ